LENSGIGFEMLVHGKKTGLVMAKSISQVQRQTQFGLHFSVDMLVLMSLKFLAFTTLKKMSPVPKVAQL
jgi:hypothetical protein